MNGLKAINETHGHSVGDEVLCALADSVRSSTREADMTGRLGGDNFVTILTDARLDGARLVAARVSRSFKRLMKQRRLPAEATCTIRFAATHEPPGTLDEWLAELDRSGEVYSPAG